MAEPRDGGSSKSPPRITEDLRSFYAQHGVDVDRLKEGSDEGAEGCFASRFIRLNPAVDAQETLSKLKKELEDLPNNPISSEPIPVPWLDDKLGFYALPGDFKLSRSQCYQEGRIYGMDVSSGAAVAALLSNQYDKDNSTTSSTSNAPPINRVLDLCCAPGLKLCALADYLECNGCNEGVVVGVDVAEHRIATTKRILHKYRMMPASTTAAQTKEEDDSEQKQPKDPVRIRLYCGDGTKFDRHDGTNKLPALVFDSQTAREESAVSGKRKRMNKSAKARERKRLKGLATIDFRQPRSTGEEAEAETTNTDASSPKWMVRPFDCVLVDAECSTDGSLKHIRKQINASDTKGMVAALLMDQQKLKELVELQKRLAAAGFRMLKPGGTMVYSTCSLSRDQNENVVEWLLQEFADTAFLVPLDFTSAMKDSSDASNPKIKEGEWGVRFEPNLLPQHQTTTTEEGAKTPQQQMFFGGGFFLAKIGKMLQPTK